MHVPENRQLVVYGVVNNVAKDVSFSVLFILANGDRVKILDF